jgi:hypothetical protein
LSPYNVTIYLYRTPVIYKVVTFDPVPLYIICLRLGPSIPGVYVNPGFWTPKIRVLQLRPPKTIGVMPIVFYCLRICHLCQFLRIKNNAPLEARLHRIAHAMGPLLTVAPALGLHTCKENGPQAIWLNRFWCLMINTVYGLMCLLVFVLVVHKMLKLLGLRH